MTEEQKKLITALGRYVGKHIRKLFPDYVGSIRFNYFKGGLTTMNVDETTKPERSQNEG